MKTKSIVTGIALIVASVSLQAEIVRIGNLYYNLDFSNKEAEVTSPPSTEQIYLSGELKIPESVTYKDITYLVTRIGDGAFWSMPLPCPPEGECNGGDGYHRDDITHFTIPNSVTSIGSRAFEGCSMISITIPNSVTSIGDHAFWYCSSLKSITIPNSVTNIESGVFEDCCSLTRVTIPNSVTSIGDYAFLRCSSLTNITIPNSMTSIGSHAFENCSSLTSVTIPNSVTSIGSRAFRYCSSLTKVTIGNSVTNIDKEAFYGCTALSSIYNYAVVPQSISFYTFSYFTEDGKDDTIINTCILYVPKESVEAYQNAPIWQDFMEIIGVDVPEDNDTAVGDIFDKNNPATKKVLENGNVYLLTPDGKKLTLQGAGVK